MDRIVPGRWGGFPNGYQGLPTGPFADHYADYSRTARRNVAGFEMVGMGSGVDLVGHSNINEGLHDLPPPPAPYEPPVSRPARQVTGTHRRGSAPSKRYTASRAMARSTAAQRMSDVFQNSPIVPYSANTTPQELQQLVASSEADLVEQTLAVRPVEERAALAASKRAALMENAELLGHYAARGMPYAMGAYEAVNAQDAYLKRQITARQRNAALAGSVGAIAGTEVGSVAGATAAAGVVEGVTIGATIASAAARAASVFYSGMEITEAAALTGSAVGPEGTAGGAIAGTVGTVAATGLTFVATAVGGFLGAEEGRADFAAAEDFIFGRDTPREVNFNRGMDAETAINLRERQIAMDGYEAVGYGGMGGNNVGATLVGHDSYTPYQERARSDGYHPVQPLPRGEVDVADPNPNLEPRSQMPPRRPIPQKLVARHSSLAGARDAQLQSHRGKYNRVDAHQLYGQQGHNRPGDVDSSPRGKGDPIDAFIRPSYQGALYGTPSQVFDTILVSEEAPIATEQAQSPGDQDIREILRMDRDLLNYYERMSAAPGGAQNVASLVEQTSGFGTLDAYSAHVEALTEQVKTLDKIHYTQDAKGDVLANVTDWALVNDIIGMLDRHQPLG